MEKKPSGSIWQKIKKAAEKRLPASVIIGIPIALFIFILILNQFIGAVEPKQFLLAAGLVAVSSFVGVLVARFTASDQILKAEEEFKKVKVDLDNLDKAIKSSQTITRIVIEKFGKSIVTYHDLIELESKVEENGQIWVLTSALELEDAELKEIIRTNLRKKIVYTYFIPDNNKLLKIDMKRMACEWQTDCKLTKEEAQQRIKCYLVPEHFAYMTVIIYNAHNQTKTKPPTVLVKFPASDTFRKEKYPLIYQVDTQPEEAWKTFLKAMIDFMVEPTCKHVTELKIDFHDTLQTKETKENDNLLPMERKGT